MPAGVKGWGFSHASGVSSGSSVGAAMSVSFRDAPPAGAEEPKGRAFIQASAGWGATGESVSFPGSADFGFAALFDVLTGLAFRCAAVRVSRSPAARFAAASDFDDEARDDDCSARDDDVPSGRCPAAGLSCVEAGAAGCGGTVFD
ncbi:MAG: hypothetical protein ABWY00_08790, partial [Dongiaceae bacterium]